jgi:hypothetical protein
MRKAAAEQVEAATELLTRHPQSAYVFRQAGSHDGRSLDAEDVSGTA